MRERVHNLAGQIDGPSDAEQFHTLLQTAGLHLEHIVSHAQITPVGTWYDQARPEWVLLLAGQAELEFFDGQRISLQAGDHLLIAAHRQHRVSFTSLDARWLALHFQDDPQNSAS